jgi:gluconate 2-dehydrogenase gamma chain
MDRRENLKVLLSGTVATGFLLSTGCGPEETKVSEQIIKGYGRTPEELIHDQKILGETFFNDNEKKMVTILSDIIIPKDEKSGSATDAGVPDFIEFMMKDYPKFQVTMRGGLMWLDNLSRKTFDKSFTEISPEQRIQLVDLIAYPDTAAPEMQYGVKFFNLIRNLTCTGFFTTKIGFDDLGYVGNRPNQWDGVPQDVLDKFNLRYDQKTLDVCLKIEDQQKIAQWDDEGNLI